MWSLVMFDLPVGTKAQQRAATRFRNQLLDSGYTMLQFSVYVRYLPVGGLSPATLSQIRRALPSGGEVRVFHISDKQWSSALRFAAAESTKPEPQPTQLAFF